MEKTFPKSDLAELVGLQVGQGFEGYKVVQDEISGTRRWSIDHEMIFEHGGKFYLTNYSVGATESQDEGPYEYYGNDIVCFEVTPVEKTITVYEPVKDD